MQTGAQRSEAALAKLVSEGAGAASVADNACAAWRDVAAALSPIIGQQGMAALYRRSLHLARARHPGLPAAALDEEDSGDFAQLHAALASQPSADAAAATSALLAAFCELLSSLIGASLTERLLASVWDKLPGGHTPQGPPP